jgi:hypothetical protein
VPQCREENVCACQFQLAIHFKDFNENFYELRAIEDGTTIRVMDA